MIGSEQTGLGNVPTAGQNRGGGGGGSAGDTNGLFKRDFDVLFGPGLLSEWGYEPFLDSQMYTLTGASPYVRSDSYSGGVLTGPGGAGSAAVTRANGAGGSAGQNMIANPRNQPWGMGGFLTIANNLAADTIIYLASMSGAADEVTLLLRGTDSLTIAQILVIGAASGTGTTQQACNAVATLGSGIVVGTNNFYRYLIGFDPATGLCKAAVNGILAGSCSPGTTMPTQPMSPISSVRTNPTAIPDIQRLQGLWWGYGL